MKVVTRPADKIDGAEDVADCGYDAWKRAKVEGGLAQAQDRSAMIPVERLLRDLGFSRSG
ncbi:hypothetical protein [Sphingomonas sp. LT1P40]|uniref:hypothetical protein n=1 Tax=Alteristakelama amylovorans TaxID=3096166 RepID=UPI002FC5A499